MFIWSKLYFKKERFIMENKKVIMLGYITAIMVLLFPVLGYDEVFFKPLLTSSLEDLISVGWFSNSLDLSYRILPYSQLIFIAGLLLMTISLINKKLGLSMFARVLIAISSVMMIFHFEGFYDLKNCNVGFYLWMMSGIIMFASLFEFNISISTLQKREINLVKGLFIFTLASSFIFVMYHMIFPKPSYDNHLFNGLQEALSAFKVILAILVIMNIRNASMLERIILVSAGIYANIASVLNSMFYLGFDFYYNYISEVFSITFYLILMIIFIGLFICRKMEIVTKIVVFALLLIVFINRSKILPLPNFVVTLTYSGFTYLIVFLLMTKNYLKEKVLNEAVNKIA